MSHDPLAPIWARLDSVQPVFFHADLERSLNGVHDRLVDLGVLKESTPSLYAQCTECGGGHLVRAVWVPNARTGRDEPRLPCPTCGPVATSTDNLRRWVVDVPELLDRVCAATAIKGARAELVPNHLWFVGTAVWGGRSHQVCFARATHARTRGPVIAALKSRPRAVLLHPTEHAAGLWGRPRSTRPWRWNRWWDSAPTD